MPSSKSLDFTFQANFVTTIVLVFISIIGTIGNCLVIAIYRRTETRSTIKLIILLAIVDLVVCLVDIPLTLILDVWNVIANEPICRTFGAIKGFLVLLSPEILVLIAIERVSQINFQLSKEEMFTTMVVAELFLLILNSCSSVIMALFTSNVKTIEINLVPPIMELTEYLWRPEDFVMIKKLNGTRFEKYQESSCVLDTTFMPRIAYQYYHMSLCFTLFSILVTLIVLYSVIICFILNKQSQMTNRYGPYYRGSLWSMNTHANELNLGHNRLMKTNSQPNMNGVSEQDEIKKKRSLLSIAICSATNSPSKYLTEKMNNNYKNESRAGIKIITPSTDSGFLTPSEPQQRKFVLLNSTKSVDLKLNRRIKNNRKPQIRTVKTLAFITIIFMTSYSPQILYAVLRKSQILIDSNKNYHVLTTVIFYLYYLSCCLNPFVYSYNNPNFQIQIRKLFKRKYIYCDQKNSKLNNNK